MTVVDFRIDRIGRKFPVTVVKAAAPVQWALLSALSNGEWWDYHALFDKVAWVIPAGDALARRETDRQREWRRHFERKGLPVPEVVPPRKRPEDPTLALLKARMTMFSQRVAWLRSCGYVIYHPQDGRQRVQITEKGLRLYAAYQEQMGMTG